MSAKSFRWMMVCAAACGSTAAGTAQAPTPHPQPRPIRLTAGGETLSVSIRRVDLDGDESATWRGDSAPHGRVVGQATLDVTTPAGGRAEVRLTVTGASRVVWGGGGRFAAARVGPDGPAATVRSPRLVLQSASDQHGLAVAVSGPGWAGPARVDHAAGGVVVHLPCRSGPDAPAVASVTLRGVVGDATKRRPDCT
jgi:hypothetical protein